MTRPPLLRVIGVLEVIVVRRVDLVKCVLLVPPEVVIKASPVDAMEVQVVQEEVLTQASNQPVARRVASAASSASAVANQSHTWAIFRPEQPSGCSASVFGRASALPAGRSR